MADKLKLALIGPGSMGSGHLKDIEKIDNIELVAVCDIDQPHADKKAAEAGVPAFYDGVKMMDEIKPQAVLIATPHYDHTTFSLAAFERGIHVLTEKPVGAHAADVEKTTQAYDEAKKKYPGLLFAAMFQQRTYGYWIKIREMIQQGDLGKLIRGSWIITDWFRTQSYYDNGGWRATWKGEGGGVLLNQCPHNLDLFQWMMGMPDRISGTAALGKYHNIEVEDEVTAVFHYDSGMVGHFITSTGESPGTNRLEIVGENGKLVFEDNNLTFFKNDKSMLDQIKDCENGFDKCKVEKIDVKYDHHGESGHRFITENFADALLNGKELLAPAVEGYASVAMANAVLLSSHLGGQPVALPLDSKKFADLLEDRIKNSTFTKEVKERKDVDLSSSY